MSDNPIVAANTVFGAKLLNQFATTQPHTNIVFSPFSITLALLLAHAGATGDTEQAIENTIGLGRISRERAASEANSLIRLLAALDQHGASSSGPFGAEEPTWLRIANAIFVNQQVDLRPAYSEIVREQFAATVAALDFGSPTATATIDAWVSEQTRGKIREIAGELNNDTAAVLLNAVYFKAAWANPFVDSATRNDTFTLASGETIQVPMMANTERYGYRRESSFEVVALPFRGGQLEMLVVLPERVSGIAALTRNFASPGAWQALDPRPARVALRMPRFRVECDLSLNEPLIALGMGVAFDNRADFSPMVQPPERLRISEVRHKTFLDVNEKGVEAAAATAIKMMRMSAIPERPIEVTIDRPFLCALRERQSGTLLFIGSIARPF